MTVASEVAYVERAWTGVETEFATGMRADAQADLQLVHRTVAGVRTPLQLNVHYTVSLSPEAKIAAVQPLAAMLAAPAMIEIGRETSALQQVDFQDNSRYGQQTHEDIADRGAMRDAEQRAKLGLLESSALRVARGRMVAPLSGAIADRYVAFDANEQLVAIPGPAVSIDTGPVQFASRMSILSTIVLAPLLFLTTAGYFAAGDGGGARYKRVVSEPAHAGKVQSQDGQWWELSEDVVSVLMLGAKRDAITDDTSAIQDAVSIGRRTYVPRGTYRTTNEIAVPAGGSLDGDGVDITIIRQETSGLHGLRVPSGASASNLTVDLVHGDDTQAGSCFILPTASIAPRLFNCKAANANRQGFTGDGTQRGQFTMLSAEGCGHRGCNMSGASNDNIFTVFHAKDCGFSGFLFGFGSSRNIVQSLRISGTAISPALIIHMGSNDNTVDGFTISDPAGSAEPFIQIGAACQGNKLSNGNMRGVNNRAILIRNEDVLEPPAASYGVTNGPVKDNTLKGISIVGIASGTITGIYIEEVVGQEHGIDNITFEDFFIDGVTHAARDVTNTATNCNFRHFRFGAISGRKWFLPTGKGHRCFDYPGVTDVMSLASATAELPAAPTYVSGADIANPFPMTVEIVVAAQAGAGAGTRRASAGGAFVASLASLGNGTFMLGPGQRIEATQGSTGAGVWRWSAAA